MKSEGDERARSEASTVVGRVGIVPDGCRERATRGTGAVMRPPPFDVVLLRKDFPMLHRKVNGNPLIYLDNAATTHKPLAVVEALSRFYSEEYATVHRAVYDTAVVATDKYAAARGKVARLINARFDEEVIFTRGTTDSINLAARALGRAFVEPGDEVIISEMEHHSNILPWQFVAKERGAILKVLPCDERLEPDLDILRKYLTKKTKVVAMAHVTNSAGTVFPIREIVAMARRVGAKVLVDGAQAVAHMEVDVQDSGVDFYAFSGHKLYGPTGIGVLYGKKKVLDLLPPVSGGGEMVSDVTFASTTFEPTPFKFEAGTPPVAEAIGLGVAIDYVLSVGREKIRMWKDLLVEYATERLLRTEGVRLFGRPEGHASGGRGGIVGFTVEDVHPFDIGTMLNLRGIAIRTGRLCAQPAIEKEGHFALARISFGMYNTYREVDMFIAALEEVLADLRVVSS
ncbi:MAG: SufS family cysteine desulfurase [Simkaniaceae bacterium]|nr:SufS family cysteine desulfurase [Simkaniaceae bacterium]